MDRTCKEEVIKFQFIELTDSYCAEPASSFLPTSQVSASRYLLKDGGLIYSCHPRY